MLPPFLLRLQTGFNNSKASTRIAISCGFGLGILLFGLLIVRNSAKEPTPVAISPTAIPAAIAPTPTPTPATIEAQLSGLPVSPDNAYSHPMGVMIENAPEARPQSGLGQADIVYEAIAEGGITRFLAIYGNPSLPIRVGPVRSARPYYVDIANELHAIYVHAGGSKDGLAEIANTSVYNIDGLIADSLFVRDYSRSVSSEHTLYSATNILWNYSILNQKWPQNLTIPAWKFQDDALTTLRGKANTISVSVTLPLYADTWKYEPASNLYLRTMAGIPHIDVNTNTQITTKNVVLQTVQRSDDTESYGSIVKPISRYVLTGSGKAVLFQNGQTLNAIWRKSSDGRTRYYTSDTNTEISFVRGNTWVHLVEASSAVSY